MGDEGFSLGKKGEGMLVEFSYVGICRWEKGCGKERVEYLFEQVLDGCLGLLFVVCRLWGDVGGLRELGVLVEVAFCL